MLQTNSELCLYVKFYAKQPSMCVCVCVCVYIHINNMYSICNTYMAPTNHNSLLYMNDYRLTRLMCLSPNVANDKSDMLANNVSICYGRLLH